MHVLLMFNLLVCLAQPPSGQTPVQRPEDTGGLVTARIEDRLVKVFDFDERMLGNFEDMPMNWNKVTGLGYPWFLEPRFDMETGHLAPPSFRLALQGGSVGAHYLAKDIPVHPSSDYQITAWVRPAGLVHANAYVSAYFLDHAFRRIPASERRSPPVRGAGEDEPWTPIVVDLPGGLQNAAWIGLSCRVEQPDPAEETPRQPRPIDHHDVQATAWFDDIRVLRLPRTTLRLGNPSGVFPADQPVSCSVRVADPDGAGLAARLEILDVNQQVLHSRQVPTVGLDGAEHDVPVKNLPAGFHTARLTVTVGPDVLLIRQQSFVRLNPDLASASRGGQGIGLILDPPSLRHRRITEQLLRVIQPAAVKLPLWRADTGAEDILRGDADLSALLRALRDLNVDVVGTLEAAPKPLSDQPGKPRRSLIDVLSSSPSEWRPYLALLLMRYGGQIRSWQVGAEAWSEPPPDPRWPAAIENVRAELRPLVGEPDIVVSAPIHLVTDARALPADTLSLALPARLATTSWSDQLTGKQGPGHHRCWVAAETLDPARYDRASRLTEFARRLVTAWTAGAEMVFVPQPWTTEVTDGDVTATPTEELIPLRTLTQSLGGLRPKASIWVDHGLHAWLFAREAADDAAIVLWSEGQLDQPREATLDVGREARRIDLWSNVTPTRSSEDGQVFAVDAMPVVLSPVVFWRAKMQSTFAIDDPALQVTVDEHQRAVTLSNPLDRNVRGTLRLRPPSGWRVQPRTIDVDLPPGGYGQWPINIRIPNNQSVGDYVLLGKLSFEDRHFGDLTMRAPICVRCPGLDVNVMTALEGDRLRIGHRITNLTDQTLALRTFLIAPDTPFQTRLISSLGSGRTIVEAYEVPRAARLAGQHIRLTVQQIGGPMQHNQVIKFD